MSAAVEEERRPEVALEEDPEKKQKLKEMVERIRKKIDNQQVIGEKPALDKKEQMAKYYYDIRQSKNLKTYISIEILAKVEAPPPSGIDHMKRKEEEEAQFTKEKG